ncbi:diguanylate cyclase [Litchfieldia salsa]|uniref:Diguanylate cyclase (GGDEF) domain-containing protein n=1 Tax=Litchfieldia salsa TaxID=930152 RepID=A0A1H0WVY3_9BACI|nr:diguanylate cyclase [Litchfieldia salsa]SDP94817.1 diguanylate cyclase (GGDEF) domain-containing protein [Litchfieldia salsa]
MSLLNIKIKGYLATIFLVSIFISINYLLTAEISIPNWVIIFALVGSLALLNYFTIYIPPRDNIISMDSAIYLASLYLFGMELTLYVLITISLIFFFYQQKISWYNQIFNFSIYIIMINVAYELFLFSGGTIGQINTDNLFPYIISLASYFIVNIFLVILYFILEGSNTIENILRRISSDKTFLASYFTTMLLAIILGILLDYEKFFGLFLFVCIAMLLSFAFDEHYKLYQATLEKANKDYLTGLNNHGYFKELLEKQIANVHENQSTLNVALLDIDDFKKYNDLYGHIQGDSLLTFFGQLLEQEAKASKYIVARYGGEEFTILLPNTSSSEAFLFINDLRKKVNDTYFTGVEALPYGCLSFSAGIVEYESGVYNSSELLQKADKAMYHSKAQGKNIVHVYSECLEANPQSPAIAERDLEDAEQQLKIFLAKDIYTYRHSKRVFQYAMDLSNYLDLSEGEKKTLVLGALIHDIGKLEIPRDILNKKEKLEQSEWEMIKKHVTFGKEIIGSNKKFDALLPLVELHHERYDGKGYPRGLRGQNIPKLARILCIIDSFDAMTTERPYQKTKSFREGILELRRCAGEQFDPVFVEPFIKMIEKNYAEKFIKNEPLSNG